MTLFNLRDIIGILCLISLAIARRLNSVNYIIKLIMPYHMANRKNIASFILSSTLVLGLICMMSLPTTKTAYAQQQTITITGTSNDDTIFIDEVDTDSEVCATPGVTVSGSGVTSLGPTSSCPDNNANHGWDITPNAIAVNNAYAVDGVSGDQDRIKVVATTETDNDLFRLNADRYELEDDPGNDKYRLSGTLETSGEGEDISYSDHRGKDVVTFGE